MDKDKEEKVGARPQADQALVASDGAPAGLHPAGVDPSRTLSAMRRYLREAREEGVVPVSWHLSEPAAQGLAVDGARPATVLGLKVHIHDEWSWGWMMTAKRHPYDFDSGATFWTPRSDSDGSPTGGDACGSVEDDSAVPPKSGNRPSPERTPHV